MDPDAIETHLSPIIKNGEIQWPLPRMGPYQAREQASTELLLNEVLNESNILFTACDEILEGKSWPVDSKCGPRSKLEVVLPLLSRLRDNVLHATIQTHIINPSD